MNLRRRPFRRQEPPADVDQPETSDDSEWTFGRLLVWTTDFLKQSGVESPRLDAELLLAHACSCRRIDLYTRYGETASPQTRERFRDLVRRRAAGAPVAYLIGHREFYSLDFRVTRDVLIPRPETELLVVELLDRAEQMPGTAPLEVADVGTGCGAIAIAAAKQNPRLRLTAVDISPAALAVAAENVAVHGLNDRIELLESDLLAAVPGGRRFDMIVSNPPYVSASEMESLAVEIRQYEPRQALCGGSLGTEVIERLVEQAQPRLSAGGWLLLEIAPARLDATRTILERCGGFHRASVKNDLAGLPRVVAAQRATEQPLAAAPETHGP